MQSELQVKANIIRQQLGGSRFEAMTGAHSFTFDSREKDANLTFKYPHRKGFSHSAVKIVLNGTDLYTVTFIDMKKNFEIIQDVVENVYFDQLTELFERKTGLRTSL